MAATYTLTRPTPNPDGKRGNRKIFIRDVTFAGTYTTGGDALLPSAFGLRVIDEFNFHGTPSDGTISYPATFINSSSKIKLWETGSAGAGSAEKGSGESLTGITCRVTVVGY